MSKVIIIGGGFSGVISAIYAARNRNDVTILESNNDILKKLLITGNGRCNYFNDDQNINHYHSSNEELLTNIINEKNISELINFYDEIGIVPKIKNGYYYPYSNQAISMKTVLTDELKYLKVKINCNYLVENIEKSNNEFIINNELKCDKLIISTGSKAYPKTGSTGLGYKFLNKFNHSIVDVYPSLVQLRSDDKYLKELSGIRCDCKISIYSDNKYLKSEEGELQLTNYGISGICVFNLSYLYYKYKNIKAIINFIPFINTKEDFIDYMNNRSNKSRKEKVSELLEGILNYKLINAILKKSNISLNKKYNELTNEEKNILSKNIIEYEMIINGTNNFEKAQVCMGGIPLDEINLDNCMSKYIDNLYITGEILDVNGDCGGYNLTFSFITGYLAGKSIK